MNRKARVIAFYLPQFHPIPENDKWWGKGFTEWTNVGRAKPLFRGHYQPHVPADLGYYDLRMPEVREAQAKMAREAGIEGFCYWHYWFGNGKQLLERPFNEVLASGKPDFPFCLGWANESWSNKSWEEGTRQVKTSILMQQEYSQEDYIAHFNYLLPAFRDCRYIYVDGKPLFLIYRPHDIPNVNEFITLWNDMAKQNGLLGIHFVAVQQNYIPETTSVWNGLQKNFPDQSDELHTQLFKMGFDAISSRGYFRAERMARSRFDIIRRYIQRKLFNHISISICDQHEVNKYLYVPSDYNENVYPTLFPCWDRTPRSGKKARIFVNSTPTEFHYQVNEALKLIVNKKPQHKLLFLQSWNEWAEGNYVEPDLKYGHGYLDVLKDCIIEPS